MQASEEPKDRRAADAATDLLERPSTEAHYLERELEERFRHDPAITSFLSRSVLDGLWYWDLEQPDQEWMSEDFWRLFGIDPATKSHHPDEWQDLIHPDDRDVALENFQRHCADPSHPYDQIVRYRHSDGSTVWVRCRGMAVRTDDGTPIRMLGAHTDVTALKLAEEELEHKVTELENANAELGAFASAMSHDLKSPLNTLGLILTEIGEELGDDAPEIVARLLQRGLATIGRAGGLVEDVLDYTRVVNDPLSFEPVDLNAIVRDVIDDVGSEISDGDISVEIEDLPVVTANRLQMQVLLHNLIGNAMKFRNPDGPHHVSVQGELVDRMILLHVIDTGIGIPEDRHEQVFEMFTRLHLRTDFKGSGLGLALCRKIALNHGGSIEIDSEPGRGTHMIVFLPQEVAR